MKSIEQVIQNLGGGTPFFLIRSEILDQNIDGFRKALTKLYPNFIIAYSVKTNSLPWIINHLCGQSIYAEVVSDEELKLATLSGCNTANVVFNGPIKSVDKVAEVLHAGGVVNIDSHREVDFLCQTKTKGRIGIRINVSPELFDSSDVDYLNDGLRFGFSDETGEFGSVVEALYKAYGHRRFGLHMHVNSATRSPAVYKILAEQAAKLIVKHNLDCPFVDIGGGFFGGVPGKTMPEEYIGVIKDAFGETVDVRRTSLIIEPGSAVIGSCIELYTKVLDIRDTGKARIVTTDGSRIHIDPLWQKRGYLHTLVADREPYQRQVICGYTCMDHDRIMIVENEKELNAGDFIIYHRVGNYTVTFGGPFIRTFPDVYAEVGNEIVHVRHKMSIEDYYNVES